MESVEFKAVLSNIVNIRPGADAEFKMKVPANEVQEIIKMTGMGQLSMRMRVEVTNDTQGKNLVNVIWTNMRVGDVKEEGEDKEPQE